MKENIMETYFTVVELCQLIMSTQIMIKDLRDMMILYAAHISYIGKSERVES